MSKIYEFEAVIHPVPDKGGAYVIFPYDIREEFGKGRVKVHATFDEHPYDGSIVNMGIKDEAGNVCYIIGIQKAIRATIGKEAGDRVQVTIQERLDHAKRMKKFRFQKAKIITKHQSKEYTRDRGELQ